jgi:hypothetical protein
MRISQFDFVAAAKDDDPECARRVSDAQQSFAPSKSLSQVVKTNSFNGSLKEPQEQRRHW